MPLRADALARAVGAAPDLTAFDSWVRVDMHTYRLRSGGLRLRRIRRRLGRLDRVLTRSRDGTERAVVDAVGPAAPRGATACSRSSGCRCSWPTGTRRSRRWHAAAIVVGYSTTRRSTTTPGEMFTDLSPAPGAARWFARHALPVDPLRAREIIDVLERSGARPADPPLGT